jgi:hypothetical protein
MKRSNRRDALKKMVEGNSAVTAAPFIKTF